MIDQIIAYNKTFVEHVVLSVMPMLENVVLHETEEVRVDCVIA